MRTPFLRSCLVRALTRDKRRLESGAGNEFRDLGFYDLLYFGEVFGSISFEAEDKQRLSIRRPDESPTVLERNAGTIDSVDLMPEGLEMSGDLGSDVELGFVGAIDTDLGGGEGFGEVG